MEHATGIDTSTLATKRDFAALKAEVEQLDINKLVSFATGLNNLKTKGDDLDIGKLKTILVHLTKLGDVVHKQVVKKTKYKSK